MEHCRSQGLLHAERTHHERDSTGGSGVTCQISDPEVRLTFECRANESGGVQCEAVGFHTYHRISLHTLNHSLAGNGYACESISEEKLWERT